MQRKPGHLGSLSYLKVGVWQTIPNNKCGEPDPQDQRVNNSQLFNRKEPRSLDRHAQLALPRNLQIKIDNIVANIKRKLMEFRNAPLQQNPAESILWDKQINLSHLLKKAEKKRQADLWTMALSRQTRTRDISQSRMSRPITRPMLRTISQASH